MENVAEGGNLRFPVSQSDLTLASDIVNRVRRGEVLSEVLSSVGQARVPPPLQWEDGKSRSLLVMYTDLEPDDVMAVAELWRLKLEQRQLGIPRWWCFQQTLDH